MLKDFKQFILRGNVVDLAIAVVIGAAFGAVVAALVADLITPLIAAIVAQPNFSSLFFTVNNSKFLYGHFINTVLTFIIIAVVVFFLIVVPMNALIRHYRPEAPVTPPETRPCPECLSDIPPAARRCKFCGARVAPTAEP